MTMLCRHIKRHIVTPVEIILSTSTNILSPVIASTAMNFKNSLCVLTGLIWYKLVTKKF